MSWGTSDRVCVVMGCGRRSEDDGSKYPDPLRPFLFFFVFSFFASFLITAVLPPALARTATL